MRWLGASSAALVLVVTTSGCAGAPSPGPMNLGGPDRWITCVSSTGEKVTVGDLFSIPGAQNATLTDLRLVNSTGIDHHASYVLPADDGYLGAGKYPPRIAAWAERRPVSGATVEAGEEESFVLVLAPTGDGPHTSDGFAITYEIAGTKYENQNFVGFELKDICDE